MYFSTYDFSCYVLSEQNLLEFCAAILDKKLCLIVYVSS